MTQFAVKNMSSQSPLFHPIFEANLEKGIKANIRYLGSKNRVSKMILDLAGMPIEKSVFIDAFAGTGSVAREAANRGWSVRINDLLYSATVMASSSVVSIDDAPFVKLGGYETAINQLNKLDGIEGFMWRTYSPASKQFETIERRYFTEENAKKIDSVRLRITEWAYDGLITPLEERLLIADLIVSVSQIANIAGTYGCFMREWNSNARHLLTLSTRRLLSKSVRVEVFNIDVNEVPTNSNDLLYLDPPYTKRQYAAYYHILETIAHGA